MGRLFGKNLDIRFIGTRLGILGSIGFARDEGPRITVEAVRSVQSDADRAIVRVWNLPKGMANRLVESTQELKDDIRAIKKKSSFQLGDEARFQQISQLLRSNRVGIYGGLGDRRDLLFLGDPIRVKPFVRDGLDYYTEIELGDAFYVLQELAAAATYGNLENSAGLLQLARTVSNIQNEKDIEAVLATATVNAATANLGGYSMIVGRPIDHINGITDLLDLRWWVKDGEFKLIRRSEFLRDFAIVLDERQNLLSLSEPEDNGFREFEAIAGPNIHPGRAVKFVPLEGGPYYGRIFHTRMMLDTHSSAWQIIGRSPPAEFSALNLKLING